MQEALGQQPTQNTDSNNEAIQQSSDEIVKRQKMTANKMFEKSTGQAEKNENVQENGDIELSKEVSQKLSEYGFRIEGKKILIDGKAELEFDENTKSVTITIDKQGEVEIHIKNKEGLPDNLLIAKNSFKINGKEYRFGNEKTLVENRAEKNKTSKITLTELDIDHDLPGGKRVEYSFRLPSGEQILVTSDKNNPSYSSFKLHIGNKEEMREITVLDVNRYRDGGTTIIKTNEGILYVPTPFRRNTVNPTWTPA